MLRQKDSALQLAASEVWLHSSACRNSKTECSRHSVCLSGFNTIYQKTEWRCTGFSHARKIKVYQGSYKSYIADLILLEGGWWGHPT